MRCLNDLALLESTDAEMAFAERLALWIHFTDAIPLSAIHNGALPVSQPLQANTAAESLSAEFNRSKAMLVNTIIKVCSAPPGESVSGLPSLPLEAPTSAASAWPPYRRFYAAQQYEMDTRIQPLRAKLRTALATASPRLKKLAELDAMFEKILRGRELELLARVPLLLKTRFEQLFKLHRAQLQSGDHPHQTDHPGQPDDRAAWMQGEGWLNRFCKDMQSLLLAEADLRLQPALGLLEAFKKEPTQ
ncbi:MAG: hypothetical protein JWP36_2074 [Paucimonas sp.]|nr:hypothetical protein [Paucimonas sp.]